MTDTSTIPTWPKIEALTRADGSGEVTINGTSHPIETNNAAEARQQITQLVTATARTLNRPVHVSTSGPEGTWRIIVHPDGQIEDANPTPPPTAATRRASRRTDRQTVIPRTSTLPSDDRSSAEAPSPPEQPAEPPTEQPGRLSAPLRDRSWKPTPEHLPSHDPADAVTSPADSTSPSPYSTESLLQQLRPSPRRRAQEGWRSWFGLAPSKRELALVDDLDSVRTQFPRAVTVMVANPKGGGGKTPTSLVIAGEMGTARGGGVVVWDNNELRGNARDRSYFPHGRSVADLLQAADQLERPNASFTELAFFLAHQTHGKYYVLSSDPSGKALMDQEQVRRVHRILARFFEVIIIDTGNNEKAPNWLAGRDLADCLVVPMKWRQDSILVANRMLATMAEENSPLLQRTLLVGTNGPGDSQRHSRQAVLARFGPNHPITEIRTDPHIHAGSIIDRRELHARTQRAGLQAASTVARLCVDATTETA